MPLSNIQLEIANAIFAHEELTILRPAAHINIYRNTILTTLRNTMKNLYPLVLKLVGEDYFYLLVNEYIEQYPSRSSNLHDYGSYFSDFLTNHSALKHLIYLKEVAYFEWACHRIFFAADANDFDFSALKKLSQQQYNQIHFILNPASQLIKFYFPILRIIDLCEGKIEKIDINDGGVNLLIIRREFNLNLISLTRAEFAFLFALQESETFAAALEKAHAIAKDFAITEKLPQWIKEKTIVGF